MLKIALAVAVAAFTGVAADKAERAHLVVLKSLEAPETNNYLVQGKPFEVTYTITNVGDRDAQNVQITDAFPEPDFEVKKGSSVMTFASIPEGGNETATLVIVPRGAGIMTVGRAEVTYTYTPSAASHEDEDSEDEGAGSEPVTVTTLSSTPGRVEIVKPDVYDRQGVSHNVQAVIVAAFSALLVLVPWVQYNEVRKASA